MLDSHLRRKSGVGTSLYSNNNSYKSSVRKNPPRVTEVKMMILPFIAGLLSLASLISSYVVIPSSSVYLPVFTPPLPRPVEANREDNRLVPGPVRGPYEYQGGNAGARRGWAARYIDSVWGEQSG
eukprot:GFUD01015155.1.p1 GENE.GFUD01015155.1~~GFUD01015155.1.p1  ORF type:complete len:125 (+),score=25.59 GFUD01015155.1:287-661(+)